MNTITFIVFGLTRPGIEPESTVSGVNALSNQINHNWFKRTKVTQRNSKIKTPTPQTTN